jgi:hypothetical protein
MATCAQLTTCCGTLASAEQSGCMTVANAGNMADCSAAYTAYQCM